MRQNNKKYEKQRSECEHLETNIVKKEVYLSFVRRKS